MSNQQYLLQIKDPIHLVHAALTFARVIAYPDLPITAYLEKLDHAAENASESLPAALSEKERGIRLARHLFGPSGYHGNAARYYDPRNSFLNEVLDRRLGIPISLSVLYIEIGKRFGFEIRGVALPGHFITQLSADGEAIYIDPFHGGRTLTASECDHLVRSTAGRQSDFNPSWLEPVGEKEILARMLANLRATYLQLQDWEKALRVMELLQITQPDQHGHTRDQGLIYSHIGATTEAIYFLEAYLLRNFNARDAASVRARLAELVQKQARSN